MTVITRARVCVVDGKKVVCPNRPLAYIVMWCVTNNVQRKIQCPARKVEYVYGDGKSIDAVTITAAERREIVVVVDPKLWNRRYVPAGVPVNGTIQDVQLRNTHTYIGYTRLLGRTRCAIAITILCITYTTGVISGGGGRIVLRRLIRFRDKKKKRITLAVRTTSAD